ncbi:MAG: sensor histidine kinase, partial [Mycobacteriaceae bacterium]|nr:sensor histidine kinase [Mycobacteriaceae bacterium]
MGWRDFAEMVGWALGCSVPLVLLGWLVVWLARGRSLVLSMVVLVLIPTLAT